MYNCRYCNKPYNTFNSVRKHEVRCHSNPDYKSIEYRCKYCGRPSYSLSGSHIHERYCDDKPEHPIDIETTYKSFQCQFCGKICKNKNSLSNHERLCRKNPGRSIPHNLGKPRLDLLGRTPWNKGLTKDTDMRIAKAALSVKQGYANGRLVSRNKGIPLSDTQKNNLRKIAQERHYESHFGKRCSYSYNNCKFISTYEVSVAKSLDANGVRWIQPKRLPYKDTEGKTHYYTADFYLPDYDIYLDPKNDYLINNSNPKLGYKDTDKIKWVEEYNDVKILILNKDQLTWDCISKLIEEL